MLRQAEGQGFYQRFEEPKQTFRLKWKMGITETRYSKRKSVTEMDDRRKKLQVERTAFYWHFIIACISLFYYFFVILHFICNWNLVFTECEGRIFRFHRISGQFPLACILWYCVKILYLDSLYLSLGMSVIFFWSSNLKKSWSINQNIKSISRSPSEIFNIHSK